MAIKVDFKEFLIGLIVIVLSIALHEFGHAISADRLGDPGPRRDGRITLWPDKHFEIVGFIMVCITLLFGFGLGWGKPVVVDSRNFRNPKRGFMIVAAFGPLMNLILAVLFSLILRGAFARYQITDWNSMELWLQDTVLGQFAFQFVFINLALMFFNFIPITPLDGSKVLSGLLPYSQAVRYERFMAQWGMLLLLLIIFLPFGGQIIVAPTVSAAHALLGLS